MPPIRLCSRTARRVAALWIPLVAGSLQPASLALAQAASEAPEEIVVRGEKVERSLLKTQSSVAVTQEQFLRENGEDRISDVLARTPGAFVGGSGQQFSIRGVPLEGVSGFTESDVFSVYIDGAIQSNRNVTFNAAGLWDVKQVEVYRGSQSTVQGRNAQLGSVVIETHDPSFEPTVIGRVNYGSYNTRGISGVTGGALVPGLIAWRLSFDEQRSDGFIRNEGRGEDGDRQRSNNSRAKLLFTPTDAVEAVLTFAHSESRSGTKSVNSADRDPFRRETTNNVDGHTEAGQDATILDVSLELSESWSLQSLSNYNRDAFESTLDLDTLAGPAPDLILQDFLERTFVQELRLAYDGGSLRGQVGSYFFRLRGKRSRGGAVRIEDQLAGAFDGGAEQVLAAYPDGFFAARRQLADRDVDNRALFGGIDWEFAPRWELSLGARYDTELNRNRPSRIREIQELNGVDPDVDAVIDDFTATEPRQSFSDRYRAFLPRIGLAFQMTDHVRLGLSAQKGYRAGGSFVNLSTLQNVAFDPEYTKSYELSLRSTWLDDRLGFNANAYFIRYEDQQVMVRTDPDDDFATQVENAGKSELFGVEFDTTYAVTDALQLRGAGSVSRSVYREFATDFADQSGLEFENAPKLKLSAGIRYALGDAWVLSTNATYQSRSTGEYEFGDLGQPTGTQARNSAAFTVNAAVQWSFSQSGAVLVEGRNLFNEENVEQNRFDTSVIVNEPRSLGISIRYEFR
jgi:iron complex outermembrane recepter protein